MNKYTKASKFSDLELESEGFNFCLDQQILAFTSSPYSLADLKLKNGNDQVLDHFLASGNHSGLLRITAIEQII